MENKPRIEQLIDDLKGCILRAADLKTIQRLLNIGETALDIGLVGYFVTILVYGFSKERFDSSLENIAGFIFSTLIFSSLWFFVFATVRYVKYQTGAYILSEEQQMKQLHIAISNEIIRDPVKNNPYWDAFKEWNPVPEGKITRWVRIILGKIKSIVTKQSQKVTEQPFSEHAKPANEVNMLDKEKFLETMGIKAKTKINEDALIRYHDYVQAEVKVSRVPLSFEDWKEEYLQKV